MGAKWSGDRFTWMEAEDRLLASPLARIQRGADSLRARPWLADVPAAREELPGLDVDLSVEKELYGHEFLHGAPLFMHQLSHVWLDFRGIQDAFMRRQAIDYFENSRRATYVNQQYAIRNPKGFRDYGQHAWGITASNGPGPTTRRVRGVTRRFLGYVARGVPYGPDDGTLAPWAVAASLPFAPEIVLPTLAHSSKKYPNMENEYGLVCSLNPTFPGRESGYSGWISKDHFALDQGPVILMIE